MQVTITLPDHITVSRLKNSAVVVVESAKLSADIIARLVDHGLSQKIGDKSAGAKEKCGAMGEVAWAVNEMTACRDLLYAGEWGAERGATGLTDEERAEYHVAEVTLLAKKSKDDVKRFRALADDKRVALIEKALAGLRGTESFIAAVAKRVDEVERMRADRIARETAAKELAETIGDLSW